MREQRTVQNMIATIRAIRIPMKRVLVVSYTDKPVLSCRLLARASTKNLREHAFVATKKGTNVFNSSLNKPDGTNFHQITDENPHHERPVPSGFPCQPQRQDESYADFTQRAELLSSHTG